MITDTLKSKSECHATNIGHLNSWMLGKFNQFWSTTSMPNVMSGHGGRQERRWLWTPFWTTLPRYRLLFLGLSVMTDIQSCVPRSTGLLYSLYTCRSNLVTWYIAWAWSLPQRLVEGIPWTFVNFHPQIWTAWCKFQEKLENGEEWERRWDKKNGKRKL